MDGDVDRQQGYIALLDEDRFEGRFRDAVHQVDASDLMRRLLKEEMTDFDGRPLFPERRAYTVNYELSDPEEQLYLAVTDYVTHEMTRADWLAQQGGGGGNQKRAIVGFALTMLQRRLGPSGGGRSFRCPPLPHCAHRRNAGGRQVPATRPGLGSVVEVELWDDISASADTRWKFLKEFVLHGIETPLSPRLTDGEMRVYHAEE
jgi:hypothetical protein